MTRQQVKDWLEGVGFIAVIASLVFVGIETRNGAIQTELNTEAIEMAAYQELIQSINEMNTVAIENPLLRATIDKVEAGESVLTEAEASVFSYWLWMRIRHGDMAFHQYQRGAIDEARLRSALSPLFPTISGPYGRQEWRWRQRVFEPEYRDYINEVVGEIEAAGGEYRPFAKPVN
jgi:hypothetical protein